MERAQFVGEDGKSWWLYDIETDSRIDDARRELGLAFQTTEREWFNEPLQRQGLFDLLYTKGSQLLIDLDTISNVEEQLQWLLAVTKLAAPPEPATGKSQPDQVGEASPAVIQTEPKPATPEAPARKSAFKAKAAADPAASGSDAGAGTAESTTPAPARLEEATQTVLSGLGSGGLAGLAQELGVQPGDLEGIVNDPDFERQVREEVAKIVGV
jgi:hypothetical protein